jgi:hypothetical protein
LDKDKEQQNETETEKLFYLIDWTNVRREQTPFLFPSSLVSFVLPAQVLLQSFLKLPSFLPSFLS